MSGSRIFPHFIGAMVLAVVIYAGGFWLDQHLRTHRGPWEVEFTRTTNGTPMIVIRQDALGIKDVRLMFPGEPASDESRSIRFDVPERPLPWGRVKYEDLTYLPGVVTLEAFGHEIELLPRTLYVNRMAMGWGPGTNITLKPSDRPATLRDPERIEGR
jgi:hypothetical protein